MSLKKKFFLLRLRHCFFSLLRLYVHSNLQLVAICMVYFDEEKKAITRETQQIKEGEDIREKKNRSIYTEGKSKYTFPFSIHEWRILKKTHSKEMVRL